jgi:hypothetical protein
MIEIGNRRSEARNITNDTNIDASNVFESDTPIRPCPTRTMRIVAVRRISAEITRFDRKKPTKQDRRTS